MSRSEASRYDIPLEQLERSVHVPLDELVTEQGQPPAPGPMPQEELDRQRLLGITSAGRLR
jgi:hypothetical protein